jgi:hypothetical protein
MSTEVYVSPDQAENVSSPDKPSHKSRVHQKPQPVTYEVVLKRLGGELTAELEAAGKSLQRVSNLRTAVNGWMKEFSLSLESPVGEDMGPSFTSHLDRHLTTLDYEGKTKQTLDDRKSLLKLFREAWVSLLQSASVSCPEGDFARALNKLVVDSDLTLPEICLRSGVSRKGLKFWRDGQHTPKRESLGAVSRLEALFNLPYGALLAKLPRVLHGELHLVETGQTGFREHLKASIKNPYLLKELPPELNDEWETVVKFHTDAAWLRIHGLRRNSKWRVREHDNKCPTADQKKRLVRKFLGYLHLPPNDAEPLVGGKGFEAETLTLGLLSDSELIYDFLQFKKHRTYLKRYNKDTRALLDFCKALLRPDTGFLWQQPEFGAKMPAPVPEAEWHEWCERNRSVFISLVKDLIREKEIRATRDPFDAIRSIIVNNQHPLNVLFQLAEDYEADRPPHGAKTQTKAFHYQFLLLLRFATLVPLRVFNFSVMTYRKDNTGNLYQRPDGSWWVRFSPEYFKNTEGAAKDENFDVPLHESLWPYIQEFLSVHRPHLTGAGACDYLFRPSRGCKRENIDKPISERILSKHVLKITRRYIEDCPGFSMHAFRHLVATEYIKNNPAGYAVAAAILHDREETVRSIYAWVVSADKFVYWNQYVNTLMSDHREERKAA